MNCWLRGQILSAGSAPGIALVRGRCCIRSAAKNLFPILLLVVLVLGGIYGGVFTPPAAGAAGALVAGGGVVGASASAGPPQPGRVPANASSSAQARPFRAAGMVMKEWGE